MTKSLFPHQLGYGDDDYGQPGDWIIKVREGQYYLGNRTYPSCKQCQEAIDRLDAALPDLLETASMVVDCWTGGDLAEAVRSLDEALQRAFGVRSSSQ